MSRELSTIYLRIDLHQQHFADSSSEPSWANVANTSPHQRRRMAQGNTKAKQSAQGDYPELKMPIDECLDRRPILCVCACVSAKRSCTDTIHFGGGDAPLWYQQKLLLSLLAAWQRVTQLLRELLHSLQALLRRLGLA
jgi:hypothetical protein